MLSKKHTVHEIVENFLASIESVAPTSDDCEATLVELDEACQLLGIDEAFVVFRAKVQHGEGNYNDAFVSFHGDLLKAASKKTSAQTTKRMNFALKNATRWHSSVFRCYVFCLSHLYEICEFYASEESGATPSIGKLCQLVDTSGKIQHLQEELNDYVQTFAKVAEYMNWLAESYRWKEPACSIYNREQAVLHDLKLTMAKPDCPAQVALAKALHDVWTTYVPPSANHRPELVLVWKALLPHNIRRVKHFTADEFVAAMGMNGRNKEVLKREWTTYLAQHANTQNTQEEMKSPSRWWRRPEIVQEFPTLAPLAEFWCGCLVVVTICDAAQSTEGFMFSGRQNRLDKQFAGRVLAAKLNMESEQAV